MVHVIARCVIKEGSLEKFLQILNDNIPNVLAEDGCIRYEACLDADAGVGAPADPNAVTILETWKSPEHLKAHLATWPLTAKRSLRCANRRPSPSSNRRNIRTGGAGP